MARATDEQKRAIERELGMAYLEPTLIEWSGIAEIDGPKRKRLTEQDRIIREMEKAEAPPNNLEAEQALLGALLKSNRVVQRVSNFLRAEHFADPVHGRIYDAICREVEAGRLANPITLKNRFDQDGSLAEIGGAEYLVALLQSVVTVLNAEDYGRTIYDLYQRRKLLELSARIARQARSMDLPAEAVAADAVRELGRVSAGGGGRSKREVSEGIYEGQKRPVDISPTGIAPLDAAIGGGLIAGQLYAVAARKKVGKTILLGTISHNINRGRVRHTFIPMEMGADEIEKRNIARDMGFNSIKFLTRDYGPLDSKVGEYAATIAERDYTTYEHKPGATLDDICRIVARDVMRGAKGIILDYWQLVAGRDSRETEEFHLRTVAQTLADLTRKYNIWILTAAQINQDGNTRGGEGLKLACDMYLTLHREKNEVGAWLEMEESRFTVYENVGSEGMPGIWLHSNGPHFSADPPPMSRATYSAMAR